MNKEIKIGEKSYPMIANLGTAILYRDLTKRDWTQDLVSVKEKKVPVALSLTIIQEMAYCMNVQATSSTLEEMEAKLNKNDYFLWISQFDLASFGKDCMTEIMGLWNSQDKSVIEGKN